jgi:hypothetical protein
MAWPAGLEMLTVNGPRGASPSVNRNTPAQLSPLWES